VEEMKVLLCSVPYGSLTGTLQTANSPLPPGALGLPWGSYWQIPIEPLGILRISTWMEKNGYDCDIYDINNLRPSDLELIKFFKKAKPTVVGLSAVLSHSYLYAKHIIKILRAHFPDIWIVLGGHLSGSSNVVLEKTETDICVVGDGEIAFVKLLDYFKSHPNRHALNYEKLSQIEGIAFLDKNNELKVTGNAEQLPSSEMDYHDLDKLKIGLKKYGGSDELFDGYFPQVRNISNVEKQLLKGQMYPQLFECYEKTKNKKVGMIHTSKGCVARCTFCQRQTKGYRVLETSDLETHIIKLKEKHDVGVLLLMEENFASDRKHAYEIARLLKKHNLYWVAPNVRSTSVTYEDLKFYRENNMIAIKFGIETGSQKLLDVMEKKLTTKNLFNAIKNCKKAQVQTLPQNMIIGMPGETVDTIIESAQYNSKLRYELGMDWNINDPGLLISTPGTPTYEYGQQIGVIGKTIDEEEDYLINLGNVDGAAERILGYVNLTNSSIKEVYYWTYLYHYAGKKAYVDLIFKSNKSIKNRLSLIYELCIKATIGELTVRHKMNKKYSEHKMCEEDVGTLLNKSSAKKDKDKKGQNKVEQQPIFQANDLRASLRSRNYYFMRKMEYIVSIMTVFLISLSAIFLPKNILFSIVRLYANVKFYFLKRDNSDAILFNEKYVDTVNNKFRLTEDRIAKFDRQAERSLRSIVMKNREQMKPAESDMEKGLQLLAEGQ
jgi:anaerobic magnesium-protoporphyrin IX monomethyl ester cyclase